MLQLPQTGARVVGVSRTAQRRRQAMLLVRRHRTHPSGVPHAASARLQPKMLRTLSFPTNTRT